MSLQNMCCNFQRHTQNRPQNFREDCGTQLCIATSSKTELSKVIKIYRELVCES